MRDILLTLIVFGLSLWVLTRSSIGVLVWSWLGYMNPHRLCYGFARSFPFSALIAAATLISFFVSKEKKTMHWTPVTVLLIIWVLWMCLTTAFAVFPDNAIEELKRTLKIQLMIFLTLILMNDRKKLEALVWVIALSIGFYGIKGGLFAILHGFNYRIWGPEDSFIGGNNEIALALVMIIPLFRYLQLYAKNKYIRYAMGASILLLCCAVLSSYSRGAWLAGGMMGIFFIINSKQKFRIIIAVLIIAPILYSALPSKWFERLDTIESYEDDGSAMGRINAWHFAFNFSKDHPVMGGGYGTFNRQLFYIYAPEPENYHDAHSIIFEVLGEQGYVGLAIFLSLGLLTFLSIYWIYMNTRGSPELEWCRDLSLMIFASLIGYITGGMFVGLAYFDLPYHLIVMVVIIRQHVKQFKQSSQHHGRGSGPGIENEKAEVTPATANGLARRNKLGVRID